MVRERVQVSDNIERMREEFETNKTVAKQREERLEKIQRECEEARQEKGRADIEDLRREQIRRQHESDLVAKSQIVGVIQRLWRSYDFRNGPPKKKVVSKGKKKKT